MNLSKASHDRDIKIGDTVNQTSETKRRIGLGKAEFGYPRPIFKNKMTNSLKRKVFDSCVIPVPTCGAETLTLTKESEKNLE